MLELIKRSKIERKKKTFFLHKSENLILSKKAQRYGNSKLLSYNRINKVLIIETRNKIANSAKDQINDKIKY